MSKFIIDTDIKRNITLFESIEKSAKIKIKIRYDNFRVSNVLGTIIFSFDFCYNYSRFLQNVNLLLII